MFTAYFDESGHSAETEFMSVGGFVGDEEQWKLFDQRWNEALAPYNLGYFHMREVRGRVPKDEHPALAAALVGVIASVEITGIGAVMKVTDFRAFDQKTQEAMQDPFYTLFQEAVAGSAVLAKLEPKETKVNLVWDQNTEFGGLAKPLYEVMRSTQHIENDRLGTLRFQDGRTTPGLQAADLFSWELRRFYTELAVKPEYEARWPLEQIIRGPAGNGGLALVKYLSHRYMQLQLLGAVGDYQDARNTLLKLLGEKFRQ